MSRLADHPGNCASALLVAVSCAVFALSTAWASPATRAEADAFFRAGDWERAAAAYESLAAAAPADGPTWLQLGIALHRLGKHEEAVRAYRRAEANGVYSISLLVNAAAAHAMLGHPDEAFDYLERAVAKGASASVLEGVPALGKLRADPRFEAIAHEAEINERPCEHLPVYRQFDFWVGEWEVFDVQGGKVGENVIEKVSDGCTLIENWTSASGSTGKSLNYYDAGKGQWVQLWVDSSADIIALEGTMRDGAMHLAGEHLFRTGGRELIRGTWTPLPDGRVRQYFEQSRDDGKTWYPWFDGYYRRKP